MQLIVAKFIFLDFFSVFFVYYKICIQNGNFTKSGILTARG
jgi:hypothetical protein